MWPLLVCSIIALGVVIERLLFLTAVSLGRSEKVERDFFRALESGDEKAAIEAASRSRDYVVRVLTQAVKEGASPSVLVHAATAELKRFTRGLTVLDTTITVSPLLGLLGTVTGMINAFGLLGAAELSAPTVITGGIAEALIATAFGLTIAIGSLLPFNYLTSRVEEARTDIEQAARMMEAIQARRGR